MGAWSHGSFANDDALDWVAALSTSGSDAIVQALATIPEHDDEYLEAPAACAAVAAAEVVAAQAGLPAAKLPAKVSAWVAGQPRPSPELIALAQSRLSSDSSERLAELLNMQQRRALSNSERTELDSLMEYYHLGQLRKATALRVAVQRGILPSPLP